MWFLIIETVVEHVYEWHSIKYLLKIYLKSSVILNLRSKEKLQLILTFISSDFHKVMGQQGKNCSYLLKPHT
jgi:hypothetical protein